MKKLTPTERSTNYLQSGGTALGIVIGVVASVLVVAAGAVWYAKTQSPVVNRVSPKETLSAAEEALKNKDWNPNDALFGKPPPVSLQAMAASAVAAASAAASAVVATDPGTAKKPESAASTPSAAQAPAAKVNTDPIGDLVKAKAQGAAPVVTGQIGKQPDSKNEDSTGAYYVQAGAFKQAEDANAQKAKLAILGVATKVFEHEQGGKPIFRVRAGPFAKLDEAESMKSKLEKAGFDAALVKSPK